MSGKRRVVMSDHTRQRREACVRLISGYRAAKAGDLTASLVQGALNPLVREISGDDRRGLTYMATITDEVVEIAAAMVGADPDRLWAAVSARLLDRG